MAVYVVLNPHSNTNPSDKYLVVENAAWVAYSNGHLQVLPFEAACDEWKDAQAVQEALNKKAVEAEAHLKQVMELANTIALHCEAIADGRLPEDRWPFQAALIAENAERLLAWCPEIGPGADIVQASTKKPSIALDDTRITGIIGLTRPVDVSRRTGRRQGPDKTDYTSYGSNGPRE